MGDGMKVLYFDCPAGISGDMTLGALLDLGVDEAVLRAELAKLGLTGEYEMTVAKAEKRGVTGTHAKVKLAHDHHAINDHEHEHHHHHRHLTDIVELIEQSGLKPAVRERAVSLFQELARAEGKVHGVPPEEVHFHEVGAVDSIVDIVGVCIAMDMVGADRVLFSAINTGSGRVRCQHGLMPVPAPATAELLTGVLSYTDGTQSELTTPTGALVARGFGQGFGPLPPVVIDRVGYGLGTKEFDFPNAVRALLCHTAEGTEAQTVWQLECNIDNMTGEAAGYAMEKALAAGALDVWFTPIAMKKNRPAILCAALCDDAHRPAVEAALLTHTTTLGVRRVAMERTTLLRQMVTVETAWGQVRVKVADGPAGPKVAPEYDDCRAAAERSGQPLLTVTAEAQRLAALKF